MSGIIEFAGGALFVVAFILFGKIRRESQKCFDMLQETEAAKRYMQMLKEVGVGKGIVRCQGVDFTVTTISHDTYGGWHLQAEDTKTLTKRLTYTSEDQA